MRGTTLRGFSPRKETWKRKSRTKEDLAGDGKGLYLVPFMRWEVFGGSGSGSLWRMDCGGQARVKAENYRCSAAFIYKHRLFGPPWRAQSIEEISFGGPAE